jgi:hypothetical protein
MPTNSNETAELPSLEDRIVSLSDWWEAEQSTSSTPTPLVDLRSSEDYEQRRPYCGDSNKLLLVPFSIEFLKERSFELPARHVEFSIFLNPSDLEGAQQFLMGPKANARKRPRKPWRVTHVLLDTPDFWDQARDLGLCDESASNSKGPVFPLPRLWQPDPMVQNIFLPLLKQLPLSGDDAQIWDLASGSGRDAAFLAEELLASNKSFDVVGLDHRYNDKETTIVNGFWDRRGIGDKTASKQMDLSHWDTVAKAIDNKNVAALYAVRFWKPTLVESMADSTALAPGTLFALSHFCKPYEGAPWDFEHPSEKTVLERNQLHSLFKEKWEILHDEIALDSDHGRTMIQFVAMRR